MLRNRENSLVPHGRTTPPLPRGRDPGRVAGPITTPGKKPSPATRRLAFNRLRDREIVGKLFDDLGPRYAKRNGGYLRILKTGFRKGDNAPLALVLLLDQPEKPAEEKKEDKKAA